MIRGLARAVWLALAAVLLLLPALPLPAWTGAPDQGPLWAPNLASWGIGLAVVVVGGLLAGRLGMHAVRAPLSWPEPRHAPAVAGLALALTLLSAWVLRGLFASNPQLVDEVAQLLHARAFASGRLAAPAPYPPEAFLVANTWITRAGWVSLYPPGQTLLLALGLLAHAEWLVNPLLGGASTLLIYWTVRGLYGRRTALVAACCWVASAWVMFLSGTYANHVGAVALSLAAWALVLGRRRPGPWHLALSGAALAAVAATRPLDAVAAALPVLTWVLARRRWRAVPWMIVGGVPVMLAWGYVNWRLYGSPLTLGYTAAYDPRFGLGFGTDPWGEPFTPLVALSNAAVAVRRLHIYLFEWPIPALVPLAVWAVLARQRSWQDLVVGVGVLATPALYFFYWHSGFYLGPRFYYGAVPFLVIATARAWRWAWVAARRRRWPWLRADVAFAAVTAIVLLWGWVGILPRRVAIYRAARETLKSHPERQLKALGVNRALVLVPESWASGTIVRLWGMGVDPGLVERGYRRLDTCDLYRLVEAARREGWSGAEMTNRLRTAIDTVKRPPTPLTSWPDPSIRLRAGTPPPECQAGLRRDLSGFTVYGYLAWRNPMGLDTGIVFARDLQEDNGALLARYAGWDLWRYAPPSEAPTGPPVLTHLGTVPALATP